MRKNACAAVRSPRRCRVGTSLLALILIVPGAAYGQAPAVAASSEPSAAVPASHAPIYRALIGRTSYEATAGTPFPLRVTLLPDKPPPGAFVTVNVERLSGPENGRVESVSGIPDTDILCSSPGLYRLRVRVDLVTKGSCGGVEATPLLERAIEVVVH